jgi:hypothetical protein
MNAIKEARANDVPLSNPWRLKIRTLTLAVQAIPEAMSFIKVTLSAP